MLRDNFFNRLFRTEPREGGVYRIVTNAPDAPETTIEHADEIRGIRMEGADELMALEDAIDDHAMTAAADTLPDPFARQASEMDTMRALDQAIQELANRQHTAHGVQRAEDAPIVQGGTITLSDVAAPFRENPYGSTFTYDTLLRSPIIDRAEANSRCRRELDTLIQAIANMVSKRQQAFLRGTHTREDPLDDYGAELVRIFAEEEPHIYEQAMRSGSELAQTTITTDS